MRVLVFVSVNANMSMRARTRTHAYLYVCKNIYLPRNNGRYSEYSERQLKLSTRETQDQKAKFIVDQAVQSITNNYTHTHTVSIILSTNVSQTTKR